jgi:subtilisin family serine protease
MKLAFARLLVFTAALTATACTGIPSPPPQAPVEAHASERQILIMLKEFSLQHFQPGAGYNPNYSKRPANPRQTRVAADLAREYGLTLMNEWPMPALGVRCFLAEVQSDQARADVVARLADDSRVESVQAVQMFRVLGHNDRYYELQTSAQALRLDELHRMSTGRKVRIAQVDTGVDTKHPDLEGQLAQPTNFVDDSSFAPERHGTAVAGIIVAKPDNGVGIAGIAPAAVLMPLRACWEPSNEEGALCTSFTLAKALQFALQRQAQILNLSLAGPRDRLLERLLDKAAEQGVTVIGAVDEAAPNSFPTAHPQVIAVAMQATRAVDRRAILAPGEGVLTTAPNASWGFVSGASFAAAHVTAITALLLEVSPRLKPAQVAVLLHEHTEQALPGAGPVLNACAMLAQISKGRPCTCCEPGVTSRSRRPANGHSS